MKKQLLVMFVAAASLTAACKKNNDEDGTGRSKLLSKVTEVEDGVSSVYLLSYDNKNRISAYKSEDGQETETFTYDGNGNLTKIESVDGDYRDVFEIEYNAAGEPTTAVHTYYVGDEVSDTENLTYKVQAGRVTEIETHLEDGSYKFLLSYENDNIKKIAVDSELPMTMEFAYGNRKSPFYSGAKYVVDIQSSIKFFSKNEIKSLKSTIFTDMESSISYTYDSDGYPTTSTSTIESPTGNSTITSKYEYK